MKVNKFSNKSIIFEEYIIAFIKNNRSVDDEKKTTQRFDDYIKNLY